MAIAINEIPGEIFRQKREDMRLSVREVEEKTGVSRSTISNLENGKSVPDGVNLLRLMSFFDLTAEDLAS